jgi:hypothetical protein
LIKKQKESHLGCGLFGEKKNLLPPAGFELSTNRITTAAYRFLRHGIDQPDAYRLTIDRTRWQYHWLFDIQVSRSIYNSSNKHRLNGVPVRIHFLSHILCVTSIRIWNMRTYHTPLCKNSCIVSVQTKTTAARNIALRSYRCGIRVVSDMPKFCIWLCRYGCVIQL